MAAHSTMEKFVFFFLGFLLSFFFFFFLGGGTLLVNLPELMPSLPLSAPPGDSGLCCCVPWYTCDVSQTLFVSLSSRFYTSPLGFTLFRITSCGN